jgi:hypothetical protein
MTESEYEVSNEDANADFREMKSQETDTKSMVKAYEEEEREEKEEKKKKLSEAKDKVIVEDNKYQKQ